MLETHTPSKGTIATEKSTQAMRHSRDSFLSALTRGAELISTRGSPWLGQAHSLVDWAMRNPETMVETLCLPNPRVSCLTT